MHRIIQLPAFPGVAALFRTPSSTVVCAVATVGIGAVAASAAANGAKYFSNAQHVHTIVAKLTENVHITRCLARVRSFVRRITESKDAKGNNNTQQKYIHHGGTIANSTVDPLCSLAIQQTKIHPPHLPSNKQLMHAPHVYKADHDPKTALLQLLCQYVQARPTLTQLRCQPLQDRTSRTHLLLLKWYTGMVLLEKAGFAAYVHKPVLAVPWYGMGLTNVACEVSARASMRLAALDFEQLRLVVEPCFQHYVSASTQELTRASSQSVSPNHAIDLTPKITPALSVTQNTRKPRPTKITMPPKDVERTGLEGHHIPTAIPLESLSGTKAVSNISPPKSLNAYHAAARTSIRKQGQISTSNASSWVPQSHPEAPDYLSNHSY
jgi:hypothetical protein